MTKENLHTVNSIKTFSGEYFDFIEMNPDTIKIEDIAHALSNVPRWMGHTNKFYSVAQHSCWCHDNTKGNKFEALMHDTTEAYLGDIAKPLKKLLPYYQVIEDRLSRVLATKFDFMYPYSDFTKIVDETALIYEWEHMRLADSMDYWSHEKAEQEFLNRFYTYRN